jgi:hypothetical protein
MNDHGDGGVDLTGGWYDGRIFSMSSFDCIVMNANCMFCGKCVHAYSYSKPEMLFPQLETT